VPSRLNRLDVVLDFSVDDSLVGVDGSLVITIPSAEFGKDGFVGNYSFVEPEESAGLRLERDAAAALSPTDGPGSGSSSVQEQQWHDSESRPTKDGQAKGKTRSSPKKPRRPKSGRSNISTWQFSEEHDGK